MPEELISSLALLFIYIVGGLLQFRSSRRTKGRISVNETEIDALREEKKALEENLAKHILLVQDLREQTQKLGHIQILYDTLNESHILLQEAHKKLSEKVTAQETKIAKLGAELADERAAREAEAKRNAELILALDAERAEKHTIAIENRVLHQVLQDIGVEYARMVATLQETKNDPSSSSGNGAI